MAWAQDAPPDPATAAQDEAWAVRLARMEGASVHVEEAAAELADTAGRIADSGRVQALSDLSSDAGQLNRRVVSLTLATEVLVELEPAPSAP